MLMLASLLVAVCPACVNVGVSVGSCVPCVCH